MKWEQLNILGGSVLESGGADTAAAAAAALCLHIYIIDCAEDGFITHKLRIMTVRAYLKAYIIVYQTLFRSSMIFI